MRHLFLSVVYACTLLQADFLRIEAGGGVWSESPSGQITHERDNKAVDLHEDLGLESSNDLYLWALLKHPIPLIPNARIEFAKTVRSGDSDNAFLWKRETHAQGSAYELQLQQIDAAVYYNLLDNLFWVTLDLGVNMKFVQAQYDFSEPTSSNSDDFSLPMLFSRVRANLPASGFGTEAELKYFALSDSSATDIIIKLDYTFDTPLLQPAIEIGYRYVTLQCDHNDFKTNSDLDVILSGLFVGAALRF